MSEAKTYQCPNCGGQVRFVIGEQALVCRHCGHEFEPGEWDVALPVAKEQESSKDTQNRLNAGSVGEFLLHAPWDTVDENTPGVKEYSCPSCGARVFADQSVMSTRCPYCSNTMLVSGIATKETVPDLILPFLIDKESAREILAEHFANKFYLPTGFTVSVEHMQPLYVPYWLLNVYTEGELGWIMSRNVNKTTYYKYSFRGGAGSHRLVPVDASARMPDAYMDAISPFDLKNLEGFTTQYVAGFMMEAPDVSKEACGWRAQSMAERSLRHNLEESICEEAGLKRDTIKSDSWFSGVQVRGKLADKIDSRVATSVLCVLPVWILHATWKGEDLLFAINGRTGECVGDLPVSSVKRSVFIYVIGPLLCVLVLAMAASASCTSSGNYVRSASSATNSATGTVAFLIILLLSIIYIISSIDRYYVSQLKTAVRSKDSREAQASGGVRITKNVSSGWCTSEAEARKKYREALNK